MSGETYYPRHSELDTQADRELDAAQERIRELEAQLRSVEALLRIASEQRDGWREQTLWLARIGLERTAEDQRRACAEAMQATADPTALTRQEAENLCLLTPLVTEGEP